MSNALLTVLRDALTDYRENFSQYVDCDDPDAYGIGEVDTDKGRINVLLGYRSVERKRGPKPTIWREWYLDGKRVRPSVLQGARIVE